MRLGCFFSFSPPPTLALVWPLGLDEWFPQSSQDTPIHRKKLRSSAPHLFMLTPSGDSTPVVSTPVVYSDFGIPIPTRQIDCIPPTPAQTRVFQNLSGTQCLGTKYTFCRSGIYYSHNCTTW